jgi:hypothetical protein
MPYSSRISFTIQRNMCIQFLTSAVEEDIRAPPCAVARKPLPQDRGGSGFLF